ncbi:hypothetical protein DVH24_009394 [Malus domestica]|uniref:Uncharacterized protein n=1 Tax=Malus domestica TaxID=3750 RepID=A0A498IVZ6_MALDO|nr:hypothetical protein DVH24_009394 [Malus domestica]
MHIDKDSSSTSIDSYRREEEFWNLVLRGQSVAFESEPKLSSDSIESKKDFSGLLFFFMGFRRRNFTKYSNM